VKDAAIKSDQVAKKGSGSALN